ncbi:Eurofung [Microthyrium microscopicum]|uniref:Glucanase n=1 Tax=Microthyrium microscopicum TaxID=703497 RepID=A0A6A6UH50_9PEZI|nr:Eurofung [Microthyrium microscopicum]
MKSTLVSAALLSVASAAPAEQSTQNATAFLAGGNPFAGASVYANTFYSKRVEAAIPKLASGLSADKAKAVAKIPSFFWMDKLERVPEIANFVADAKKMGGNVVIPLVVYDLPNRDCAALASNGEYSVKDGGAEKYKGYIKAVKDQIVAAGSQKFVLVWEPDSLANLVTNMNEQKCQEAASAYKELTAWGLKEMNLPNVAIYLDAGHAGWLGWDANLGPAANLFAQIYQSAGKPAAVRGLATNVANYNAFKFPGGACPSYAESNKVCDESRYVNKLGPMLKQKGFPANFIVDTGRSGVQPTKQQKWGNWCNVIGTGFGPRPTANTGDALVDAFVWVKPGGECDGTSDRSAPRFDAHCDSPDALKPAPQAGEWYQAYFEQLLQNANPPI